MKRAIAILSLMMIAATMEASPAPKSGTSAAKPAATAAAKTPRATPEKRLRAVKTEACWTCAHYYFYLGPTDEVYWAKVAGCEAKYCSN